MSGRHRQTVVELCSRALSSASMLISGPDPQLLMLDREIERLDVQYDEAARKLEDIDTLYASRRMPFAEEVERLNVTRGEKIMFRLSLLKRMDRDENEDETLHSRPTALSFVEGLRFRCACNLVLVLNIAVMTFAPTQPPAGLAPKVFKMLDPLFLFWYVGEFCIRAAYYKRDLLFGRPREVSWNWLDLFIVITGIIDEWAYFLDTSAYDFDNLRMLRLLRIFRVLKLLRVFLQTDLTWCKSAKFEGVMSVVIGINAVLVALELDYEHWWGWNYLEYVFFLTYLFELTVRIKCDGVHYFCDRSRLIWNYLDLVIVVSGALELLLMRIVTLMQHVVGVGDGNDIDLLCPEKDSVCPMLALLKIMRIMRVLRVVSLLKAVKPLYRVLMGVIEAVRAMQWVIVLTFLLLYVCAIVWTSLVGKGVLVNAEAGHQFNKVPKSFVSLFRLMNGDYDVFQAIKDYPFAQLLFMTFLIIANWSILAILTSVVSDNMINSSRKILEEEENERKKQDKVDRTRRLHALFAEMDADSNGVISEDEWNEILQDPGLRQELQQFSSLPTEDLQHLFSFMAQPSADGNSHVLEYDAFIQHLNVDFEPSVNRSLMLLTQQLRRIELAVTKMFERTSAPRSGSAAEAISTCLVEGGHQSISEDLAKNVLMDQDRNGAVHSWTDTAVLKLFEESFREHEHKSEALRLTLKSYLRQTSLAIENFERTFATLRAQFRSERSTSLQHGAPSSDDGPGLYKMISRVKVAHKANLESDEIAELEPGTVVQVLDVAHNEEDHLIWGYIMQPQGWIVLGCTDTGGRFAEVDFSSKNGLALSSPCLGIHEH